MLKANTFHCISAVTSQFYQWCNRYGIKKDCSFTYNPFHIDECLIYQLPPAFLGLETELPFLADEIFLFGIMEENFPAAILPAFLTTMPDCAAALLGGFAFDLFEFDLLILDNFSCRDKINLHRAHTAAGGY